MPAKVKIIISDTHIGAGGAEVGNRLEDFTSDRVFFQWVQGLIQESETQGLEMTLIINGDWIEFLQVPEVDAFEPTRRYATEAYTNLREEAAIQRLEVVHAGHPLVFQALEDFLSLGPPRRDLVILFGNHDPEVIYPGVQARLLELLEVRGRKQKLVRMGERRYFQDGVWVEHGNAYTEPVNMFTQPDAPWDPEKPGVIERPSGSYVVTDFYNQVEWQRPWIDGVHPMSALVFYSLAYDPLFAVQFMKTLLTSFPDLAHDLWLASGEPTEAEPGPLTRLRQESPRAVAQRLQEDPAFATAFAEETAQVLARVGAAPPTSAPGVATAPAAAPSPQERAREITEYYWQKLEQEAARVAQESGARVVAFGHIHERIQKILPNGAWYLNTGTWIWKMNFKDAPDAVWHDLIAHPEKYMHRRELTYARIDMDEEGQITQVRLLLANQPPEPPPPPQEPMPETWWARFILSIRQFIAWLTGWV